jgi:D-amino peptidase
LVRQEQETMKILIAADMEGISGVVNWDQATPSHPEYTRFRRIMTGDVNAAIRGAAQSGADEIVVTDGHANGLNILIEELDSKARLNSGAASPLDMVQGVDEGVNGVLFVGYHARAGSQHAILNHTWSSRTIAGVELNGRGVGEIGLNAALCGHFNVPVLMISGDQTACGEALDLLGPIEVAVVKRASTKMSAECLPLEISRRLICEAASRAVGRLKAGEVFQPLRVATPVHVGVEFLQPEMAEAASLLPGVTQVNGRRIEFSSPDMPAVYQTFRAATALARG